MIQGEVRGSMVQARSTDTFGRVLCSSRNHHFIIDGPVRNGCPREAITPAELFLAGVTSCGIELLQVIAQEGELTTFHTVSGWRLPHLHAARGHQ